MDSPGFDLSSIRYTETATVDILHPVSGVKTGMRVTVAGSDSPRYQAALQEMARRRAQAAPPAPGTPAPDVQDADVVELLAACTVGWEGARTGTEVLPCTPENVRRVYADPNLRWLRQQVDRAVADRSRFFA